MPQWNQRFLAWQEDLARNRPAAFFAFVIIAFGGAFLVFFLVVSPTYQWAKIIGLSAGLGIAAASISRHSLKRQGKWGSGA